MDMTVFATQMPYRKEGNALVPRFENLVEGHPVYEKLVSTYGPLKFVLGPTDAPWTRGVFDLIEIAMRTYDGDGGDHLLCLGNPILLAQMAVSAAEHSDTLRYLQWSNGEYLPVNVRLTELPT
jgi:hypothetical protein